MNNVLLVIQYRCVKFYECHCMHFPTCSYTWKYIIISMSHIVFVLCIGRILEGYIETNYKTSTYIISTSLNKKLKLTFYNKPIIIPTILYYYTIKLNKYNIYKLMGPIYYTLW